MPDIHDQFAGRGGRYVVDAAGNRQLVEDDEPAADSPTAPEPAEPVKATAKSTTTTKATTDA